MEEVGPVALTLVFGANAVLALCLWGHERSAKRASGEYAAAAAADDGAPAKQSAKKLSGPLTSSFSSIKALSAETLRLSIVMLTIYLCERHPPFPHSKKAHDMDTFWCMVAMLAICCAMNVRKGKSTEVLNREQTEEWKGWMQFIFLLYHYFSAHEVYNSVRVMITSYVWMTGFGNFSFFYMKGDYGVVRLLQMLWRLNFLVTLLCLALGNTYILYYICPLHTFYFLVVYAVMRVLPSTNYTTGVRWKLLATALIIYLVWDADLGLFNKIFFFLGDTPKIGAGSGEMWEWYFRTSLDHWSTFLGMLFALNFPVTSQWIKKVETLPTRPQWIVKGAVSAALVAAFVWWAATILPQPKLQYNTNNAYYGVAIPLLTYVFLRNLSPTLRIHYVEPLHSIGKITLETYLMQHHVWLTSNAKTVLTLVPDSPRLNMVVTTTLYVLLSKELYRLTMSLRGMLLPDAKAACLRNLAGLVAVLSAALGLAAVLTALEAGPLALCVAVAALGAATTAAVHTLLLHSPKDADGAAGGGGGGGGALTAAAGSGGGDRYNGGLLRPAAMVPALVCLLVVGGGLGLQRVGGRGGLVTPARAFEEHIGPHDHCLANINRGMWATDTAACSQAQHTLYCDSHAWKWVDIPDECHFRYLPPDEIARASAARHVAFVGDSELRMMYYAALRGIGQTTPQAHDSSAERHADLSWASGTGAGATRVSFRWAPYARNVTAALGALSRSSAKEGGAPDMVVTGAGLWDALHVRSVDRYRGDLEGVADALTAPALGGALKLWLVTTAVAEKRLPAGEKQEWLKEEKLAKYRAAAEQSSVMDGVSAVLDGFAITAPRMVDSYDGVHYSDYMYDTMVQLVYNIAEHYGWGSAAAKPADAAKPRPPVQKHIGSMGNALLGLMVVALAVIMIFSMDAYHGLARASLRVFGGEGISWEEAYGPLLAKIARGGGGTGAPRAPAPRPQPSLREHTDSGEENAPLVERSASPTLREGELSAIEMRHTSHAAHGARV
ncbi:10 TM acyl transferase domain found in Cas1p-domain-containing protein [Tribonema minus]|uniref:10 TM acyl transferase domain found in Cas1p-domain-containing protein n=1 Tax=Tribonema minus TaxID=303371 RepID=A0A835YWF0_9STRA|nr:10 TM acyl transferase domain found in Cas1p-domain-containing protein [Tribonema minus]